MKFDLANLLLMFDESLMKVIAHLENGYPDRALLRARETHKAISKLIAHCPEAQDQQVSRKL